MHAKKTLSTPICDNASMRISFVIPAYNEERYIAKCLQSILELKDPMVHEIIVVDNASTDRTAAIARSFPQVKVVHEPRKGITWARQKGLDISSGDLYAAIDADVRVSKRWLEIIKCRFKDPALVLLTGPYRYYDLPRWKQAVIRFLQWIIWKERLLRRKDSVLTRGGNTIYRMSTLRKAHGFNKNILFYGEDTDAYNRVQKFGKAVYDPAMFAWSSGRRFNAEGFWRALLRYRMNSMWQQLSHKPLLKNPELDWR